MNIYCCVLILKLFLIIKWIDAFKDGYVINYGDFFNNKTGKFEHKFKSSEIADSMKNLHLNDFNKEIA